MDEREEKELWVRFACAVIQNYEIPDKIEDDDELIDDMIEVASKAADGLLDEFEERFPPRAASRGRGARSGGGRRKPKDQPEEPEGTD